MYIFMSVDVGCCYIEYFIYIIMKPIVWYQNVECLVYNFLTEHQ